MQSIELPLESEALLQGEDGLAGWRLPAMTRGGSHAGPSMTAAAALAPGRTPRRGAEGRLLLLRGGHRLPHPHRARRGRPAHQEPPDHAPHVQGLVLVRGHLCAGAPEGLWWCSARQGAAPGGIAAEEVGDATCAHACLPGQVARAFNLVYDLKLTTRGEMEFAYLGEITTPSKCGACAGRSVASWSVQPVTHGSWRARPLAATCTGRMDQACAYGSVPVVMTFDADLLHIDKVSLAGALRVSPPRRAHLLFGAKTAWGSNCTTHTPPQSRCTLCWWTCAPPRTPPPSCGTCRRRTPSRPA